MDLLQNTAMHPQLRDEETLVIENAIRLAIDSIINVLYSVNGTRSREYERMLGDRDKEIKRLSGREKDFERELRLLRRQSCVCRLYDADVEYCSGFSDSLQSPPECSDTAGPVTCDDAGDEMASAAAAAVHGQREISFSLGLFDTSPSQVSTQSQDMVAAPPATRAAFQQTSVPHTQEAIESLEGGQTLSNSPVIKKEPDLVAICESSDLHMSTGILGNSEMLGEFRGHLYTGPDRLGPHDAEHHMSYKRRRQRRKTSYVKSEELPDEEKKKRREKWKAASTAYRERKKNVHSVLSLEVTRSVSPTATSTKQHRASSPCWFPTIGANFACLQTETTSTTVKAEGVENKER